MPPIEIRWFNAASGEIDAEAAARLAAAIVFERTQPGLLGPQAARPRARLGLGGDGGDEDRDLLGTPERPLSYVELAKHWSWHGFSPAELVGRRHPQRAPLPMSDLLRRDKLTRKRVRGRRSPGGGRSWRQVNPQIRPGRGGRRPRQEVAIRSAAQELLESLGEPELLTHKGAQIMIWDARAAGASMGVERGLLDKRGRALAFARLSGDELQKGENLGYHVQVALDLARENRVPVRWVMASVENSGYQEFDERKDLLRLERWLDLGELDAVFALHMHRLARERLEIEQICRLLRQGGADLYLGAINRKLDWHADDGMIAAWAMAAAQEGRWIKERTHGAIIRRFLLEGRGWPGSLRYGCMRAENKDVIEDPEQMQVVRWLFNRYLEISGDSGGKGGLRRLSKELAESEFATRLSHERIRTILMDPLYVTGEWYVTYNDYAIACKPVSFSEPVPEETFQRVQELLSLRGKPNSVTPLGFFLLNYIPFYHADCAGQYGPKTKQGRVLLRGELTKDGLDSISALTYRHRPWCPDDCRGLLVPKDEIEAAVIREVRRLLRTRFFRAATAAEASAAADAAQLQEPGDDGRPAEGVTDEESHARQVRDLRQALARIEQTEAASKRKWLDGVGVGSAGLEDWDEIVGEIRRERKRLETRLEALEAKKKRRRRRKRINPGDRDGYLEAAEAILTEETPEDPDHRVARAALLKALLSAVVLHHVGPDEDEHANAGGDQGEALASGYRLDLYGWLVPEDETVDDTPDALLHIKGHLDRFATSGCQGLAEDAMAENQDVGPGGSVKQAEACLTQTEARELIAALERHSRVPADLKKARVRSGTTLTKRDVDPSDLERAAFVSTIELPGPYPQPDSAAQVSSEALVKLAALAPFTSVQPRSLTVAAYKGRLRSVRLGGNYLSTRAWLTEYERDRRRWVGRRLTAKERGRRRWRRRRPLRLTR